MFFLQIALACCVKHGVHFVGGAVHREREREFVINCVAGATVKFCRANGKWHFSLGQYLRHKEPLSCVCKLRCIGAAKGPMLRGSFMPCVIGVRFCAARALMNCLSVRYSTLYT